MSRMTNGMLRSQAREVAARFAEDAPQLMREHLGAPQEVAAYCDALKKDRDTPYLEGPMGSVTSNPAHRTAMSLIPQILKAVGAQVALTVNLWQQLGVADEQAGKSMMDAALRAHEMDAETAWRLSEAFVQDYRRQTGLPELVEARRVSVPLLGQGGSE